MKRRILALVSAAVLIMAGAPGFVTQGKADIAPPPSDNSGGFK